MELLLDAVVAFLFGCAHLGTGGRERSSAYGALRALCEDSRMNSLPKIAVSAIAILALASCGNAASNAKSKAPSTASASTPASASAPPSGSPPSTAPPAAGLAMNGTGYSYH